MFSCKSRSAEFQMRCFLAGAELRKFKSQYSLINWGTSSHRLFCVRKQNCWTSRHIIFYCAEAKLRNFQSQDILCVEAELRDLKSKLLYGSGLRNFKSYLIYCMEAELRDFRATVFSLCGSGIASFQSSKSHTILYAEAELRNFKSQYIPCAEAELQAKEYSMCGSGTVELQVT